MKYRVNVVSTVARTSATTSIMQAAPAQLDSLSRVIVTADMRSAKREGTLTRAAPGRSAGPFYDEP
jgi:hypothetical protein